MTLHSIAEFTGVKNVNKPSAAVALSMIHSNALANVTRRLIG